MSSPADPPLYHWWLIALQKVVEAIDKTREAILAYDKPGEAVSGTVEVTVAEPEEKQLG